MPLKVGELFATLEIDDKDFSKGLKSAENQTKVLDAAIKASEKTVERYSAALKKAQSALREAQQGQDALVNKLNAAKQAQATLQQEVDRLNAAYKAQKKATGENSDAANELGLELLEAQNALKKSSEEVKNLSKQVGDGENNLKKLGKSVDEIVGNLDNAEQELSGFRTQLGNANTLLNSNAARLSAAGDAMQKYAQHVKEATEWQRELGNMLTLGVTMPIVGAFGYAAKEAISFEDAFAGVEKTVDGSEEDLAQLESQLVEMSHNIPVTAKELSNIAQSAGQLGIHLDTIDQFTETIAKLNSATNLGEEGATILARIANITGMEQTGENFERLGSAIVELGNTSATTESEIANMAMRLAGAGSQVGMSVSDILGISAALSSLGLQAEAGGSAISRVLTDMQLAVETGNASLKQFADVAGMTSEEFVAAFNEDAAGALAAFISGLGSGTQSATQLLDKMGITEVVITDTLKRASNAEDLFASSIENANRAYEENVALTNEAEKRNQTMASRLTMVKNRVDTAARSLGNTLMPVLEEVAEKVGEAADWFASLDEATVKNVVQWGVLAAAVGPTLKLLGTANKTFSSVAKGIGSLTKGISGAGSLGGALKALGSNISSLLGPAGIAALAAAAGFAAYKFIDMATGAAAAREAIAAMNEQAQEWAETDAMTIYDTGTTDPLARFGLSADAFSTAEDSVENWLDDLITVWTDGEAETNAQVNQFVSAFVDASDSIREQIEARGNLLEGLGVMDDATKAQMDSDLAQLEAWDAEIEALLNKRQSGFLTDEEQARLEEVIKLRAELELDYTSADTSGFNQIITNMQAEVARMNASGEIDATVYGDALNALAQGQQAYNDALNASYNAQYAQIQSIQDAATRESALAALNEQYNQQRLEGERAYQQAVQDAGTAAMEANKGSFSEQYAQIQEIAAAISDIDGIDLTALESLTAGLDEGTLAGMVALIQQLQSSGMSNEEIFAQTGVEAANLLSLIQQIRDTSAEVEGLEGLNQMFGEALPSEVTDILIGLDMTQAAADWEAFMEGKNPFETEGTVNIKLNPLDEAAINAWETQNAGIELDGPPARIGLKLGDNWENELQQALESGKLRLYDPNGIEIPVTAEAMNSLSANDLVMGVDEDGNYHITIVPEIGSKAALDTAMSQAFSDNVILPEGWNLVLNASSFIDEANNAKASLEELRDLAEQGIFVNDQGLSQGDYLGLDGANFENARIELESLANSKERLEGVATAIASIVANMQNGTLSVEEGQNMLSPLLNVLDAIDTQQFGEVGTRVSEGIAQGLNNYAGWSTDAATLTSNIRTAINNAAGIASPATTMIPTGTNMSAGIAEGMRLFSFSDAASVVSAAIKSSVVIFEDSLKSSGYNFAAGLASGIRSGQSAVIRAATQVASAAIRAANNKLEISSPSRVMMESGEYADEGLAIGMMREISTVEDAARSVAAVLTEASAVRNPARFSGGIGGYSGSRRAETIDYAMMRSAMIDAVRSIRLGVDIDSRRLATATADANSVAIDSRRGNIARGYGYR